MAPRSLRQPALNFLPAVFCLLSFVLILLLLLAGVNNSLTQIYYLKTDTTNLSIPAKLASSTFLKDLSTVSGGDFVGQPSTASTLGLASSYTISLLTTCAHFPDGSISCANPRVGAWFNPPADLRLDGTSLQGTYSDQLLSSLSSYSRTSRFLAGAYVFSAILLVLSTLAACLSAAPLGAITTSLAAILLLAASIASVVIFRNVNAAFNDDFSSSAGLTSSLGNVPVALSFVAFALALLAAAAFVVRIRSSSGPALPRGRRGPIARSVGGKEGGLLYGDAGAAGIVPGRKNESKVGGLLGKLPFVNKHKYPALVRTDVTGQQRALRVGSPSPDGGGGVRQRLDDGDWAAQDEYSHGGYGGGHNGGSGGGGGGNIPLVSMGGGGQRPTRDLDTAYEPYSNSLPK
ncbi:SUR7/PalI family-domain-containing protein [Bombardia bombarda]|uniref:SUR7/PalI family-domain-containing protein n=1 Tax=Bombardia bombarda TaxID=252184 RepID=A0AA40CGA7_9PEZI|nr:SUR7/PalI family-domain-containing protein [Bombardia bombarda]